MFGAHVFTLTCTIYETERTVGALHHIKYYLRSTISQHRLNSCCSLNIPLWHMNLTPSGIVLHFFGPGPKALDDSISLNFLLETRLKSESFETGDDLLRFQVQKLW